ncbi:MAG: dTDP-4-dehydrorhamnose 3,5-epimerase [Gammaproteobacteria bacterium]|nr:dTDP-4-dehydrorhamnose 3,5-epimerase [Gammaproteobacteria bacterium]
MNFIKTKLDGLFEIENGKFKDQRGSFVKTFNKDVFSENGLECNFKESFYSVSKKNVLRGMHFQLPPHDHAKLVYVVDGDILDVALDIRRESPTYGDFFSTRLSSENAKSLYVAKGFAHGFLTLSTSATVVYLVSTGHAPKYDAGVRWDSFGFDWNGVQSPVISIRDSSFGALKEV